MKKTSIPLLSPLKRSSTLLVRTLCALSLYQLLGAEAQARLATPETTSSSPAGGFDGAYMGINAGFLYETIKLDYQDTYLNVMTHKLTTTNKYGGLGGTFLGYLYEIGASRILIGAETNILVAKTGFKVKFAPNSTDDYGLARVFRQYSIAVTPIIGKLFNAKTFIFLKAGMETIQYKIDFNYNAAPPLIPNIAGVQGTLQTAKPKIYGFILGAGLDYLMTRQIAAGAEYNYSGLFLKYKHYDIPGTGGTESFKLKRYEHKVMLRLSFRFG